LEEALGAMLHFWVLEAKGVAMAEAMERERRTREYFIVTETVEEIGKSKRMWLKECGEDERECLLECLML
jgi:hypothetical protein